MNSVQNMNTAEMYVQAANEQELMMNCFPKVDTKKVSVHYLNVHARIFVPARTKLNPNAVCFVPRYSE